MSSHNQHFRNALLLQRLRRLDNFAYQEYLEELEAQEEEQEKEAEDDDEKKET